MKSVVMAFVGSIAMATSGNKAVPSATVATNPLHCVHVTDQGGRLVNGCYDVSRFVVSGGTLWAYCKLRGICDGVDIEKDCVVPIEVGDCDGSGLPRVGGATNVSTTSYGCDCLKISFGTCGIREVSFSLDLEPTDCSCTSADFSTQLLCSILTACHTIGTPREEIATLLNQLL